MSFLSGSHSQYQRLRVLKILALVWNERINSKVEYQLLIEIKSQPGFIEESRFPELKNKIDMFKISKAGVYTKAFPFRLEMGKKVKQRFTKTTKISSATHTLIHKEFIYLDGRILE